MLWIGESYTCGHNMPAKNQMQKKDSMPIKIPKPCSEKWDSMSPTSLGRNCAVCQTEVIDFTNWKTEDIIRYIHNADHKVCGRLKSFQQQKRLFVPRFLHSKFFQRLTAGLIFSTFIGAASGKVFHKKDDGHIQIHYTVDVDTASIQGVVVDKQNRPLIGVVIYIDDQQYTLSDDKGRFFIPLPKEDKKQVLLSFRYLGYKEKKIKVKLRKKNRKPLKVTLEEDMVTIGEIIVNPIRK